MTTAAQKSLATSTTGTACADSDSTEFVHDEQYWFDDGNVVIVAQKIGFRIYQGHLSSVSSVFNKMFDPKHAVSMYAEDGCLAISITDTATEFRALLRVLLRSTRYVLSAASHCIHHVQFTGLAQVHESSHLRIQ